MSTKVKKVRLRRELAFWERAEAAQKEYGLEPVIRPRGAEILVDIKSVDAVAARISARVRDHRQKVKNSRGPSAAEPSLIVRGRSILIIHNGVRFPTGIKVNDTALAERFLEEVNKRKPTAVNKRVSWSCVTLKEAFALLPKEIDDRPKPQHNRTLQRFQEFWAIYGTDNNKEATVQDYCDFEQVYSFWLLGESAKLTKLRAKGQQMVPACEEPVAFATVNGYFRIATDAIEAAKKKYEIAAPVPDRAKLKSEGEKQVPLISFEHMLLLVAAAYGFRLNSDGSDWARDQAGLPVRDTDDIAPWLKAARRGLFLSFTCALRGGMAPRLYWSKGNMAEDEKRPFVNMDDLTVMRGGRTNTRNGNKSHTAVAIIPMFTAYFQKIFAEDACERIGELAILRQPNGAAYESWHPLFWKLKERVGLVVDGLEGVSPHGLRRTMATYLLTIEPAKLHWVADFLGSSPEITKKFYAQVAPVETSRQLGNTASRKAGYEGALHTGRTKTARNVYAVMKLFERFGDLSFDGDEQKIGLVLLRGGSIRVTEATYRAIDKSHASQLTAQAIFGADDRVVVSLPFETTPSVAPIDVAPTFEPSLLLAPDKRQSLLEQWLAEKSTVVPMRRRRASKRFDCKEQLTLDLDVFTAA